MNEKLIYESPRVEIVEVAVEAGYSSSTESWEPGDTI